MYSNRVRDTEGPATTSMNRMNTPLFLRVLLVPHSRRYRLPTRRGAGVYPVFVVTSMFVLQIKVGRSAVFLENIQREFDSLLVRAL